jgi:vacuolar protein sorting-associated protein 13A/C
MGLVPKSSDAVVKLKDNKTNSEKWVSKTDMEGSPALTLDVSFSRPIIVMPRETDSNKLWPQIGLLTPNCLGPRVGKSF